jgi:hypothetical protein
VRRHRNLGSRPTIFPIDAPPEERRCLLRTAFLVVLKRISSCLSLGCIVSRGRFFAFSPWPFGTKVERPTALCLFIFSLLALLTMITTTSRVQVPPVKTRLTAVADVKPTPVPDVKTLKDAIPAHCFERSMIRSFSYVVRDLIIVSALFYSGVQLSQLDAPLYVTVPLWALYSFVQGCFFTGLWILAHDCGHDSFSANLTVNAVTGWFLHSILMVPFFSWKFSHARHHRYHNHMEKDTVFVPHRKSEAKTNATLLQKIVDHSAADTPIVSIAALIFHQVLGWPAYILMNAGAGPKSLTKSDRATSSAYKQSHLDPTAHVFTPSEAPFVALSNVGLLLTMGALYIASRSVGVSTVLLAYGLPYLWMNHWIGKISAPELHRSCPLTNCSCHHLPSPHP